MRHIVSNIPTAKKLVLRGIEGGEVKALGGGGGAESECQSRAPTMML